MNPLYTYAQIEKVGKNQQNLEQKIIMKEILKCMDKKSSLK